MDDCWARLLLETEKTSGTQWKPPAKRKAGQKLPHTIAPRFFITARRISGSAERKSFAVCARLLEKGKLLQKSIWESSASSAMPHGPTNSMARCTTHPFATL